MSFQVDCDQGLCSFSSTFSNFFLIKKGRLCSIEEEEEEKDN